MKEIEIEFKNLLTKEQYEKLLTFFKLHPENAIFNDNYYYDNINTLKENNCALRIRHTKNKSEMTLKIKGIEQNIEINVALNNKIVPEKLNFDELPFEIRKTLNEYNISFEIATQIAIIKTTRHEIKGYDGLIVIDKTTFKNNIVDYELEFEVNNYNEGLTNFEKLLSDFNINLKPTAPKIARAIKYQQDI